MASAAISSEPSGLSRIFLVANRSAHRPSAPLLQQRWWLSPSQKRWSAALPGWIQPRRPGEERKRQANDEHADKTDEQCAVGKCQTRVG
ncbi:MAG: hypothetical protein GPOALKHO_000908 [Sodalis sp.]|nr:MAG: hypothetical protein GPOALKHO_000908 [Sodalis sp.]